MTEEKIENIKKSVRDSVTEVLKFVCAEAKMMEGKESAFIGRMATILWSSIGTFIATTNSVINENSKNDSQEFLICMKSSCLSVLEMIDKEKTFNEA